MGSNSHPNFSIAAAAAAADEELGDTMNWWWWWCIRLTRCWNPVSCLRQRRRGRMLQRTQRRTKPPVIVGVGVKRSGIKNCFAGVLEKVGIDPQAQKVGKYKSVGDQLTCKNMSEENCEMLTSLLDNIYGNWLDNISLTKGEKREDIENFINEGVYQVERLKEDGWITNIKYDDESQKDSRLLSFELIVLEVMLLRLICILNVKVTLVEPSRPSPTLPEILVGIGNTVAGVDRTLQELLQDLASSDEIQARMDGIMFQKLDGVSNSSHLFTLIKDYLSSL